MSPIVRIQPTVLVLLACLLTGSLGALTPLRAQETKNAETSMILLDAPRDGDKVTLLAWNRADPLTPVVQAKTIIEGICLHCNIPMKFVAAQSPAKCNVCPCGATFADCLTGKSGKNVTWSEMLSALPHGAGLRVDLTDADTPQATVKRISVDLKTALLPLEKPLEMADAPLLALVKPLGVRSLERAGGDKLLRLNLKDNWTVERAAKMTKLLADHGITVRFTPESR